MNNFNTILDQIGNTPLVKSTRLVSNPNVKLFFKLEGNNPGGSVKDRPVYNMISQAIKRGIIKKGDTLVEATSGNTGIALAYISRVYELNMILIMPENSTKERVKTMQAYGAKVILTPSSIGMEGSRDLATQLQKEKGYTLLNQFENHDNWKAHYKTTGPEIWQQTNQEITHFVSAMGTTGTITGVATFFKEKNNNITIVGAQPKKGSKIPGIRKWPPAYTPGIFNKHLVDQIIEVSEEEAKQTTKNLAKEEAIFAGMSSGGAVKAALKIANKITEGTIVVVICDRGDRYLSSNLFE